MGGGRKSGEPLGKRDLAPLVFDLFVLLVSVAGIAGCGPKIASVEGNHTHMEVQFTRETSEGYELVHDLYGTLDSGRPYRGRVAFELPVEGLETMGRGRDSERLRSWDYGLPSLHIVEMSSGRVVPPRKSHWGPRWWVEATDWAELVSCQETIGRAWSISHADHWEYGVPDCGQFPAYAAVMDALREQFGLLRKAREKQRELDEVLAELAVLRSEYRQVDNEYVELKGRLRSSVVFRGGECREPDDDFLPERPPGTCASGDSMLEPVLMCGFVSFGPEACDIIVQASSLLELAGFEGLASGPACSYGVKRIVGDGYSRDDFAKDELLAGLDILSKMAIASEDEDLQDLGYLYQGVKWGWLIKELGQCAYRARSLCRRRYDEWWYEREARKRELGRELTECGRNVRRLEEVERKRRDASWAVRKKEREGEALEEERDGLRAQADVVWRSIESSIRGLPSASEVHVPSTSLEMGGPAAMGQDGVAFGVHWVPSQSFFDVDLRRALGDVRRRPRRGLMLNARLTERPGFVELSTTWYRVSSFPLKHQSMDLLVGLHGGVDDPLGFWIGVGPSMGRIVLPEYDGLFEAESAHFANNAMVIAAGAVVYPGDHLALDLRLRGTAWAGTCTCSCPPWCWACAPWRRSCRSPTSTCLRSSTRTSSAWRVPRASAAGW